VEKARGKTLEKIIAKILELTTCYTSTTQCFSGKMFHERGFLNLEEVKI